MTNSDNGVVLVEAFDDEIEKRLQPMTLSSHEEQSVAMAMACMKDAVPGKATAEGQKRDVGAGESKPTRGRPRKSSKEEFNFPIQPKIVRLVKKPRTVVNHSYRDFSFVPPELTYEAPKPNEMTFSQKLHEILSTKEYMGYISWMPHGRAFRVHVPKRFESKVTPKYFGHARYSSFLRQLNNFGFKHITKGPDRNCYYHECFLLGLPHLCKYMPKPKNARRLIPDPENEPNFYQISESFPLPDQASTVPPEATRPEQGEEEDSKPAAKSVQEDFEPITSATAGSITSPASTEPSQLGQFFLPSQTPQVPAAASFLPAELRGSSLPSNLAMSHLASAYHLGQVQPSSLSALVSLRALQQQHLTTQSAALENNAIFAAAAAAERLNSTTSRNLGLSSSLLSGLPPSMLSALLASRNGAPPQGDLPSSYLNSNSSNNNNFQLF